MKEKTKTKAILRIGILFALICVVIIGIVMLLSFHKEPKNVENQTDNPQGIVKIEETNKMGNLLICDIQITKINNSKSELRVTIKNDSAEYTESQTIKIKAFDKQGETIAEFSGLIGKMAPYEEAEFYTQVLKDISLAKSVTFEAER